MLPRNLCLDNCANECFKKVSMLVLKNASNVSASIACDKSEVKKCDKLKAFKMQRKFRLRVNV